MDVQTDIGHIVKMFAGNEPDDLADRTFGIISGHASKGVWVNLFIFGLVAVSKTRNGENVATLYCGKDRALKLLLTFPNHGELTDVKSITDHPVVSLFGTDIPASKITGRIDGYKIKLEFNLPANLDPASPKSTLYTWQPGPKGMSAIGANRFWYYQDLPHKNFMVYTKLVSRNCI